MAKEAALLASISVALKNRLCDDAPAVGRLLAWAMYALFIAFTTAYLVALVYGFFLILRSVAAQIQCVPTWMKYLY
jgi:hypothetical protein